MTIIVCYVVIVFQELFEDFTNFTVMSLVTFSHRSFPFSVLQFQPETLQIQDKFCISIRKQDRNVVMYILFNRV